MAWVHNTGHDSGRGQIPQPGLREGKMKSIPLSRQIPRGESSLTCILSANAWFRQLPS
jgi:hypothetical protein